MIGTAVHTIIEIAAAVRRGERRAVDVIEESLAAITALNPQLNAFVHIDPDLAREAAAAVDRCVASGRDPGALAGVPFGIKDFEGCIGMPTSHGSLLYKGQPPVSTDTLHVARLRAAGAVPIGATGHAPFTMLANFCWNAAISVPAGCTCEGLPVGVQIIGRRHADEVVLRLARVFERAQPWPRLAPIQTLGQ